MERYNREFNDLFDLPKPDLFVFCEQGREEAKHWERLHEDAVEGKFTHRANGAKYPGRRYRRTSMNGLALRRDGDWKNYN